MHQRTQQIIKHQQPTLFAVLKKTMRSGRADACTVMRMAGVCGCLLVAAWLLAAPCGAAANPAAPPPKRVLILLAETPNFPSYALVVAGFKERLNQQPAFAVEYSMEYLELTRNAAYPTYQKTLAACLSMKYQNNLS